MRPKNVFQRNARGAQFQFGKIAQAANDRGVDSADSKWGVAGVVYTVAAGVNSRRVAKQRITRYFHGSGPISPMSGGARLFCVEGDPAIAILAPT